MKNTEYDNRTTKTQPKKIRVTRQSRLHDQFFRTAERHLFRLEMLPRPFGPVPGNLFPMIIGSHQNLLKTSTHIIAVSVSIRVFTVISFCFSGTPPCLSRH